MSTTEPVRLANISNPIPILQQESSEITTNILIPKITSIEVNQPIKNQQGGISVFTNMTQNISSSITGFLNDLFIKPNNITWINYLQSIIKKDQRYFYIGIFFVIISILILLFQQFK